MPDDLAKKPAPAQNNAEVPAPKDELVFESEEGLDPNIDQGLIKGMQEHFQRKLAQARSEKKLSEGSPGCSEL
jgi:hypothetical protein